MPVDTRVDECEICHRRLLGSVSSGCGGSTYNWKQKETFLLSQTQNQNLECKRFTATRESRGRRERDERIPTHNTRGVWSAHERKRPLTKSNGNTMFFSGHETTSRSGVRILVTRKLTQFVTSYNTINDRIMTESNKLHATTFKHHSGVRPNCPVFTGRYWHLLQ